MANEREKCRRVWVTLQENPDWDKQTAYEYIGYEDTSDAYCFACEVANKIQEESGDDHDDCCFGCPIQYWPDGDGHYNYDYCGTVAGNLTAYELWTAAETDEERAHYAGLIVKTIDDQWLDKHK